MKIQKIIHFAVGPIGAAILGLLTTPLLTWFFSVEDIGRYSILQIVISFSTILFSLGLDQAFVRDFHEQKNAEQIFKIAITPGLLLLVSVATIALIFQSDQLSYSLYQISSFQLCLATALCCIFALIIRFFSLYLRMEERGLAFSMSQLLPKILFIIQVMCVFYILRNPQLNFSILLQIQALSLFIVMSIFIFLNSTHLKSFLLTPWHNATFIRMLAYGLPLIISGIIYWLVTSTARIVLLKFSTLTELGIYSAVTSVAAGAAVLSSIFNILWAPAIYKWHQSGINKKQLFQIYGYLLTAIYFISMLTIMFSWVFTLILPQTYNSITYLLAAAVLQPLYYALSEATAVGITIQRRTSLSVLISTVTLIINILLCILLIPKFGARGSIIAVAWSFWIFLILRTEISARLWISLPRMKLYMMTFVSTTISTYIALVSPKLPYILSISMLGLSMGFVVFFDQIMQFKSYLISKSTL